MQIFKDAIFEDSVSSKLVSSKGTSFEATKNALFSIPRMGLTDETPMKRVKDLFNGKVHLNFNGTSKEYM